MVRFIKKHRGKIFIVIFLVFTLVTVIDTYSSEPEVNEVSTLEPVNTQKVEEDNGVLVDVKGQVNSPGVYELLKTNTVMDAINAAGGLTNQSDTSNINLSKKLEDEMVIIVYSKKEIEDMQEKEVLECPPCNNACISLEDEKAKLESEDIELVNINTADATQLQTLDGIGEAKALAIIEYREVNGAFKTTEEIKNVSGIGDSLYEKIKDNITV